MTTATISAIVPAAGRGVRANLNGNKVLAPIAGQPLLWWTLRALLKAGASLHSLQLIEIIVAARPEEWDAMQAIFASLADYLPQQPANSSPHKLSTQHSALSTFKLVEGGSIRQESVANAVQAAHGDYVMVHDAARPLASPELIARVCEAAYRDGAAIPALPASDTVKAAVSQDNRLVIRQTLPRETIWLAQTPQVFRRELLANALAAAMADGFQGTDCASLVERLKQPDGQLLHPVTIVEGDALNFKVTYPADMQRAAPLLGQHDDF